MKKTSDLFFEPIYIEKPWGGSKLTGTPGTGEAFLISDFKGFETKSPAGTIPFLKKKFGQRFLGVEITREYSGLLPVYLKELDAIDNLSVQVHPDDALAGKLENEPFGKNESWIILGAAKNSGIYIGLKPGVTKEILLKILKSNEDISKLMNFVGVSPGDFFYLPAGLIHALGGNVNLLEPQQNSNRTYRVWDWGRVDKNGKSRELHIEKALEAINFDPGFNRKYSRKGTPDGSTIIKSPGFRVKLHGPESETLSLPECPSYRILTSMNGSVSIKMDNIESSTLNPGKACLVPAFIKNLSFKPDSEASLIEIIPVAKGM